jgi:hypothetical protein
MPNVELQTVIDQLVVDVSEATAGMDSAVVYVEGVNGIIANLKDQLEATGATPAQLQIITDAGVQLDAAKDKLAAALIANAGGTGIVPR